MITLGKFPAYRIMVIYIPIVGFSHQLLHGRISVHVIHATALFLHEVPHTQGGAHEIHGFQPLLELVHIGIDLFISHFHLHVPEIVRNQKHISVAEVRYRVSVPVLEPAGLEVPDTFDTVKDPVEFPFRIHLVGNHYPYIPYRTVIPDIGSARFPGMSGTVHFQLYRTGKILHGIPINLYHYLGGVISGQYLEFGFKSQFLRVFHFHFADVLAQVAVSVQETPHAADNTVLVLKERGKAEREIVGTGFTVCLHGHILHHRETGKDKPAVIIGRDGSRRIDLGSREQTVSARLPCPVRISQVILQVEIQFIVNFRQGIVHRVGHGHSGIMGIVVGPHFS